VGLDRSYRRRRRRYSCIDAAYEGGGSRVVVGVVVDPAAAAAAPVGVVSRRALEVPRTLCAVGNTARERTINAANLETLR